jgi:hypothetical protein
MTSGTDDQTIINTAISDLPQSGGVVLLVDPLYSINGPIIINKHGVHLKGIGWGYESDKTIGTTIQNTTPGSDYIRVSASSCQISDVSLSQVSGSVPTGGTGIVVSASNYTILTRLNFYGLYNGISLNATNISRIDTINLRSIQNDNISLSGANETIINNIVADGLDGQSEHGIYLVNSINLFGNNNDIMRCGKNLYISGCFSLRFTNSFFDTSNSQAVFIDGVGAPGNSDISFVNCWFSGEYDKATTGIYLDGLYNEAIYFTNSEVNGCGGHGAIITGGTNISFGDCLFKNCGQFQGGYYGIIFPSAVVPYIRIANSTFKKTSGNMIGGILENNVNYYTLIGCQAIGIPLRAGTPGLVSAIFGNIGG